MDTTHNQANRFLPQPSEHPTQIAINLWKRFWDQPRDTCIVTVFLCIMGGALCEDPSILSFTFHQFFVFVFKIFCSVTFCLISYKAKSRLDNHVYIGPWVRGARRENEEVVYEKNTTPNTPTPSVRDPSLPMVSDLLLSFHQTPIPPMANHLSGILGPSPHPIRLRNGGISITDFKHFNSKEAWEHEKKVREARYWPSKFRDSKEG